MRFIYVRSMSFQSTSKFLPGTRTVFGSLLFIADKMGYLNLQEPESWEIVGLGTDIFPLASAEVDLACEARLGHGSSRSGGGEDNIDHHKICCPDAADPIYKSSLESDSDGYREVFMVG
jgi:hypothetical protein